MASYYGVVFPEFWTGETGRELRRRGGKDAQLLSLYLTSNRFANMLGLYRLLVEDIRHETGLTVKAIVHAFEIQQTAEFAAFDAKSSVVWVRHMARFRLGLKPGQALEADDNRVVAINRLYQTLHDNPWLGDYFDQNGKTLRLKKRRESVGVVVPLVNHHHRSGLPRA